MRLISQPTAKLINNKKRSSVKRPPKLSGVTDKVMEKKRSIWRSIYRILVILVVISTLIWAFFSPVFTISDVIIVGNKNVDIESVRPAVPIALNLWRYPTSKVINNIKNVSPLISDVAIYRGVPNTIKVDIAEKVVAGF